MKNQVEITLWPDQIHEEPVIWQKASQAASIPLNKIKNIKIVRRSIDARSVRPLFRLYIEVYVQDNPPKPISWLSQLSPLKLGSPKVLIIGAGPAGYFAALELIENGLIPIILERGKDVRARRRDLRAIQQFGEVNPNSNYCFGEGGAGTYSDGKLYTRSHKRGKIEKVLQLLVDHGANSDILIDTHPHIGSNKLPPIVQNIRNTIIENGGEIHFENRVVDFIMKENEILGVITEDGKQFFGKGVILATGHSARDIYELLDKKQIGMELKPFALGIRIEHPQSLIDEIQYRQNPREINLPAASYKQVVQVKNRGVFSFCMCPGGLVVPAATSPGELVVNGMSMSRRDSPYANSGIVVAVESEDLKQYSHFGVFAGLQFQKEVEKAMFDAGDGSQKAPAQRMTDFIEGQKSDSLEDSSYIPGLFKAPLHSLLPPQIYARLKEGLIEMGKKMPGFYTAQANVIGTESRTSAPLRIPRNGETLMHPTIKGLFPCGEGAGFAGGILSAAMDGQNVAKAVADFLK
ncbi:MAG: hypothetical protein RJA52_252 [Bacteroidota bacterium]